MACISAKMLAAMGGVWSTEGLPRHQFIATLTRPTPSQPTG